MGYLRSFSLRMLLVGVGLSGLLSVASVFVLPAQTANASTTQDVTPYFSPELYDQVTKWQHYWWLASCFRNNDIGKMDAADVDGWDWFNDGDYDAVIGAMYGGSGKMDCQDGNNVVKATDIVGHTYKSRESFCKMTDAIYNGSNINGNDSEYRVCIGTSGGQWDNDQSGTIRDDTDRQYTSFRDKIGITKPAEPSQAAKYLRVYSTLINGCNMRMESEIYDTWDEAVEAAKGQSEIVPVAIITKEGENLVLKYQTAIGNRGDSNVMYVANSEKYIQGSVRGGGGQLAWSTFSCDELAAATNAYAGAYLTFIKQNGFEEGGDPTNRGSNPGDEKGQQSACAVEGGLGWVICPVMNTLATINETAFSSLEGFLEIKASTLANKDLKAAWEKFRDLANIAFIGAFMVVLYSQITGAGITNYGIKKLLPKIIIAAILVNISFWVCAVAVDLSNIIGASANSLLTSVGAGGTGGTTPDGWTKIVGGLLTGVMSVALIIALFLAPTVLLAVAVVLIILIARQAFVILLIVASPLAFVAYLLPNTNPWFKKWTKAFMAILMVYPVIGAIFGASTLASGILASAGGAEMQLAALAVMGIPLFAVPVTLKGAMNAAGSIGQKLAGLQDSANKRGLRGMKEGRLGEAKAAWDSRKQQRRVNRRVGNGTFGKINKYIDQNRFGKYIGGDKGAAAATAAYHSQFKKDVEDHEATMSGLDHSDLEKIYKDTSQSASKRAAAARMAVRHGGDQHVHAVMDYLGTADDEGLGDVQQAVAEDVSKRKPAAYGRTDISDLARGKFGKKAGEGAAKKSYNDGLSSRAAQGKFGAKEFSTMSDDELVRLSDLTADPSFNATVHAELVAEIAKYETDPQLKSNLTPERQRALDAIKARTKTLNQNGGVVTLTPVS